MSIGFAWYDFMVLPGIWENETSAVQQVAVLGTFWPSVVLPTSFVKPPLNLRVLGMAHFTLCPCGMHGNSGQGCPIKVGWLLHRTTGVQCIVDVYPLLTMVHAASTTMPALGGFIRRSIKLQWPLS